jgi:hypothetical protein
MGVRLAAVPHGSQLPFGTGSSLVPTPPHMLSGTDRCAATAAFGRSHWRQVNGEDRGGGATQNALVSGSAPLTTKIIPGCRTYKAGNMTAPERFTDG